MPTKKFSVITEQPLDTEDAYKAQLRVALSRAIDQALADTTVKTVVLNAVYNQLLQNLEAGVSVTTLATAATTLPITESPSKRTRRSRSKEGLLEVLNEIDASDPSREAVLKKYSEIGPLTEAFEAQNPWVKLIRLMVGVDSIGLRYFGAPFPIKEYRPLHSAIARCVTAARKCAITTGKSCPLGPQPINQLISDLWFALCRYYNQCTKLTSATWRRPRNPPTNPYLFSRKMGLKDTADTKSGENTDTAPGTLTKEQEDFLLESQRQRSLRGAARGASFFN